MSDVETELKRAQIEAAGGTVDGWVASIGGTTGTGHGREEALRNLAENLWREQL